MQARSRTSGSAAVGLIALSLAGAGAGLACKPTRGNAGTDNDSATASASDGGALHPMPEGARRQKAPSKCRAPTVVGGIGALPLSLGDYPPRAPADGGSSPIVDAAIAPMGEIPNDVWLELPGGSRLVAKDPVSTRETMFLGPARGRACVDYSEESWLLRGQFVSVPGAGERPGGEEWLVTPHAVVRYAAAGMRVVVSHSMTEIVVEKGSSSVWVPVDAAVRVDGDGGAQIQVPDEAGWSRIEGGLRAMARPSKPENDEDAAHAATDQCTLAAKDAHDLADRIAQAGSGGTAEAGNNMGDLAAAHVAKRRIARAACQLAQLRVEALHPSATRDSFLSFVRMADETWRAISGKPAGSIPPEVSPRP